MTSSATVHPTFILQPSHPSLVSLPPHLLPPFPHSSLHACCFPHYSCMFIFTGCNQEKIWEQQLPISAGKWSSVV